MRQVVPIFLKICSACAADRCSFSHPTVLEGVHVPLGWKIRRRSYQSRNFWLIHEIPECTVAFKEKSAACFERRVELIRSKRYIIPSRCSLLPGHSITSFSVRPIRFRVLLCKLIPEKRSERCGGPSERKVITLFLDRIVLRCFSRY